MQTITTIGLVVPQFLAFKLLKEISQGNVACEPRSELSRNLGDDGVR